MPITLTSFWTFLYLVTARREGFFHGNCFIGRFYWSINCWSSCCSVPPIFVLFTNDLLRTTVILISMPRLLCSVEILHLIYFIYVKKWLSKCSPLFFKSFPVKWNINYKIKFPDFHETFCRCCRILLILVKDSHIPLDTLWFHVRKWITVKSSNSVCLMLSTVNSYSVSVCQTHTN